MRRRYTDNAYAWARDGYAVLTFTARGLWGSCGTPDSRLAEPGALRGRLHPPRRRPLRGPRHPGAGRPPRRRARRRPAADRHHRRQLRRRPDADARGAARPGDAARRLARAVAQPRRDAASDRRRRAGDPLDRPRQRRGAQRPRLARPRSRRARSRPRRSASRRPRSSTRSSPPPSSPPARGSRPASRSCPGARWASSPPPASTPTPTSPRWVARTSAGEPYDDASATRAIVDTLARFHSAYYVPADHRPPPLYLASGLTDDLFPADEVLRFANRTTKRYPGLPMAILLGDFGHQRASNEPAERRLLLRAIHRWFDHYLRDRGRRAANRRHRLRPDLPARRAGRGALPRQALRQPRPRAASASAALSRRRSARPASTRLAARRSTRSLGWAMAALSSARAIPPARRRTRARFAPAGHSPWSARRRSARDLRSRARRRRAPRSRRGSSTSPRTAPSGSSPAAFTGPTRRSRAVWHLHPAAWAFAPGHTIELQLLGADPPYSRPANEAFETVVSHLRMRLPVRQRLRGARAG